VHTSAGTCSRRSAFIRTNNTVGYVSPKVGGFTLSLAASAGEGGGKKDIGGSLTYDQGPLSLGIAHDRGHGLDNAGPTDHLTTVVASYDFGVAKPRASVTKSQVNGEGYTSFALAVTAPVGAAGLVKAQYGHLDDGDTSVAGKQKFNRFGVGYQHSLSKRTNVFAQFSQAKAQTFTAKNVAEFGVEHSF